MKRKSKISFIEIIGVIIAILILFVLIEELANPIKRHILTKQYYKKAKSIAKTKNKKLIVIGDPCVGNIFMLFQKLFPNCGHGDITIDLYGCDNCVKMDINNLNMWKQLESDQYIVVETGTLSFSKNISSVINEIKRVSGGDFYSSGGLNTVLWKRFGHKLYSSNYSEPLNYALYPYTPDSKYYKVYDLNANKMIYLNF